MRNTKPVIPGAVVTHLSILGLQRCESLEQLRAAYRKQIKLWHPDRNSKNTEAQALATERTKALNDAFEHLKALLEDGQVPIVVKNYRNQRATAPAKRQEEFRPGFPDPGVEEIFLISTHLVSAGYNPKTGTLYLKFTDGRIYSYFEVPEPIFRQLTIVESPGRFAHSRIFAVFPSQRC